MDYETFERYLYCLWPQKGATQKACGRVLQMQKKKPLQILSTLLPTRTAVYGDPLESVHAPKVHRLPAINTFRFGGHGPLKVTKEQPDDA